MDNIMAIGKKCTPPPKTNKNNTQNRQTINCYTTQGFMRSVIRITPIKRYLDYKPASLIWGYRYMESKNGIVIMVLIFSKQPLR